jgi:hypothetical protein
MVMVPFFTFLRLLTYEWIWASTPEPSLWIIRMPCGRRGLAVNRHARLGDERLHSLMQELLSREQPRTAQAEPHTLIPEAQTARSPRPYVDGEGGGP